MEPSSVTVMVRVLDSALAMLKPDRFLPVELPEISVVLEASPVLMLVHVALMLALVDRSAPRVAHA